MVDHSCPNNVPSSENTTHYFTDHELRSDSLSSFNVQLPGFSSELFHAPGVFSWKSLDVATKVLLEYIYETKNFFDTDVQSDVLDAVPPNGNVLDIGVGWGPLALATGLYYQNIHKTHVEIYGIDVSSAARGLTTLNAQRLGLNTVKVLSPEKVRPELHFDLILSNPPIRIGKKALHDLLLSWLSRLQVHGNAYFVISKNLGADSLQRWLETSLNNANTSRYQVERAHTSKGFRILHIRRLQ